jgi:Na+-transporting NADH:ubiquinone oxidoreductase subunit F
MGIYLSDSFKWFDLYTPIVAFLSIFLFLAIIILIIKKIFFKNEIFFLSFNGTKTKVMADSNLLESLEENNIFLPAACGGKGICKQCDVQVTKGAGDPKEIDYEHFSKKQLNQGYRLACQCKIKKDMDVKLSDDQKEAKTFLAKVVSNKNVSPFIKELIIEPDLEINYKPGSFINVFIPSYRTNSSDFNIDEEFKKIWNDNNLFDVDLNFSHLKDENVIRAYSFSSFPHEDKKLLKFYIKLALPINSNNTKISKISKKHWGIATSFLFSLKENDALKLSGPFGSDKNTHREKDFIYLIGGVGIASARSSILDQLINEKTKKNIELWHGISHQNEAVDSQEMLQLSKYYKNFFYKNVVSNKKEGFLFEKFKIERLQNIENPNIYVYFLCGPTLHIEKTYKMLNDFGVDEKNIIVDECGG